MTVRRNLGAGGVRAAVLLLVAASLAGCGNTPDKAQGWRAMRIAVEEQRAKREASGGSKTASGAAQTHARAVQGALSSTKGPLMLAVLEETKRTAILGELGRNGPYRTWRTASMQTLTFRDGVLTGTRGLGYDLLSSEAGQSVSLIRGKRPGEARRVYRHLSGENHEVPATMTCKVTPGGGDKVATATGTTYSATIVKEVCRSDGRKVTNTYWVTGSGQIVQSIQWISPEVGKVALQTIRN